jgi:hypothetical protein
MFNMEPPEVRWFAQPLRGEAESEIRGDRLGRVTFQASSWYARLEDPNYHGVVRAGDPVMVLGQEGCTRLIVMPVTDGSWQSKREQHDRTIRKREEIRNSWWQWLAS